MNYKNLIGLRLESCRFSKCSYSFEFDGRVNGEYFNFDVGTSCYLSFTKERKDIGNDFSKHMWDILETNLENIILNEKDEEVIFEFEKGKKIFFWWESPLDDNLIIVRKKRSNQWFTIL